MGKPTGKIPNLAASAMRILTFLSRVALLCNIFFLVCLVLKIKHFTSSHDQESFVIITGWILAPVINGIVMVGAFAWLVTWKQLPVPKWQAVVNGVILLLQAYFIFLR